nr:protein radialis-like 5 [Quercus suber]
MKSIFLDCRNWQPASSQHSELKTLQITSSSTPEQNKRLEKALPLHDKLSPDWWQNVAKAVGLDSDS